MKQDAADCGSAVLATALLIIHGLVAVALLGAITHQTLAAWAIGGRATRFVLWPLSFRAVGLVRQRRRRSVCCSPRCWVAIIYLYFRVDVRPELERAGHWHVLGFFDLKEHFVAIGLALLPAYWVCWRRPLADEPAQTRTALTSILAFIVWWSFLTGHVANNIMGFGS